MTLFGCVWTSRHLREGVGGCQRMNQDEIAELKRQFAEQAVGGSSAGTDAPAESCQFGQPTELWKSPLRGAPYTPRWGLPRTSTRPRMTTQEPSLSGTLLPARWSRLTAQPEPKKTPLPATSRWCLKAKGVSTSRRQPAPVPVSCRCSPSSLIPGQDQRGNNGPTHRNCPSVPEP